MKNIKLSWFYPHLVEDKLVQSNKKNYYEEVIPIKKYDDIDKLNTVYNGVVLFNVFNAVDVLNDHSSELEDFNKEFDNYLYPKLKEEYADLCIIDKDRVSEYSRLYQFYDVLGYISYSIVFRIIQFISENSNYFKRSKVSHAVENAHNKYADIFGNHIYSSIEELINRMEFRCDDYNILLERIVEKEHLDSGKRRAFFDEIVDELGRIKGSKLISEYLQKEGGRCIATFHEEGNNQKYISFSGFVDTGNVDIHKALGEKDQSARFREIIKNICKENRAELVETKLEVKRYIVQKDGEVVKSKTIDDLIINGKLKAFNKQYSCCERKFFAHFDDQMPRGYLHIKFEPCGECYMGIKYQLDHGFKFDWSYGLK